MKWYQTSRDLHIHMRTENFVYLVSFYYLKIEERAARAGEEVGYKQQLGRSTELRSN